MVILAIHLSDDCPFFCNIHGKMLPQKSNIRTCQDVPAPYSYKDQMNMLGENARPAPAKVSFFYPTWHRLAYDTGMKRLQAYKYRLNVRNAATETQLSRQVGCARFVFNLGLSLSQEKYPGYTKLAALLPVLKKEHKWLAEADSIGLQQSLRNLDRAWQNFIEFPDHFDKPQFKKR